MNVDNEEYDVLTFDSISSCDIPSSYGKWAYLWVIQGIKSGQYGAKMRTQFVFVNL
jgi:hypothetical protein